MVVVVVGGLTPLAAASMVEARHVLHDAIAGHGVDTLMRSVLLSEAEGRAKLISAWIGGLTCWGQGSRLTQTNNMPRGGRHPYSFR